jgi:lambda family phage portal protein
MAYLRNLGLALRGVGRTLMGGGYDAATGGRRTLHMAASMRGMSSLALSDGPLLTARSRKAVMDNPDAAIGVHNFVSEVVGTGIRPHFLHEDRDTRKLLQKTFGISALEMSATRRTGLNGKPVSLQSFYTQQALVCRNVIEAGEAFARLRPRLERDGLRVPLQVELIEPEQLPFWLMSGEGVPAGNNVRGGVEFTQAGERAAYHFYRHHPGDSTIWPNSYEITRVPAANVLQVIEYVRGEQLRGVTPLTSILIALADLAEYADAERFKKMLGAYLFGWKKTAAPDTADPGFGAAPQKSAGNDTAPDNTAYVQAEKGQVTLLDTNLHEEWGFYTPPDVGTQYESFIKLQKQPIAAVLRNTYEMLTGDMTGVNFSSARVRLITLRRIWRQFQFNVMVDQYCRPVVHAWLEQAALAGVIDLKDYRKRPDEYQNIAWRPQRWEYVNPKDDIEADMMECKACFTSRAEKVADRGGDVEELDDQIERDHAREEEKGITPVYGNLTVREDATAKEPVQQ